MKRRFTTASAPSARRLPLHPVNTFVPRLITPFPAGVFDLFPDDGNQDEEGTGKNQADSEFEHGVGNVQNKSEGEEDEIAGDDEDAGSPED